LENPQTSWGQTSLRSYQAYLLTERKLAVGSVVGRVAALRFFFVRTLKRRDFWEELPYPKDPKDRRRLPTVLSLDEVARLIDAAGNLMQRALLMTLYGTGMRRAEVSLLKVSDIDSRRMMIRVEAPPTSADRFALGSTRSPLTHASTRSKVASTSIDICPISFAPPARLSWKAAPRLTCRGLNRIRTQISRASPTPHRILRRATQYGSLCTSLLSPPFSSCRRASAPC